MNRNIGNAFKLNSGRSNSRGQFELHSRELVAQAGYPAIGIHNSGECLVANLFAAIEFAASHIKEIAQHPEHFPGGACFSQRFNRGIETLHAPFHVHKGA